MNPSEAISQIAHCLGSGKQHGEKYCPENSTAENSTAENTVKRKVLCDQFLEHSSFILIDAFRAAFVNEFELFMVETHQMQDR